MRHIYSAAKTKQNKTTTTKKDKDQEPESQHLAILRLSLCRPANP